LTKTTGCSCPHDDALDGTINVKFFKDWNPITKAEIEARKFPDLPNTKPMLSERIAQIHVQVPSPDPNNPKPPHILSIRAFTVLWQKYSSLHGSTQTAADMFHRDLVPLLTRKRREQPEAKQQRRTTVSTPKRPGQHQPPS
jgi:hypothetical protein